MKCSQPLNLVRWEVDFTEFLSIMVDLKKLRRLRKINPQTTSAKALKEEGFTAEEVPARGRNDCESGLASPDHTANLSELVLGCFEADLCELLYSN